MSCTTKSRTVSKANLYNQALITYYISPSRMVKKKTAIAPADLMDFERLGKTL